MREQIIFSKFGLVIKAEELVESIKKCPNCGNWSSWNHEIDDRCEHCNALLDPQRVEAIERREERESQQKPFIKLIEIHPDEHPIIRLFKKTFRGAQIAFMAIISFLIWLIAVIGS